MNEEKDPTRETLQALFIKPYAYTPARAYADAIDARISHLIAVHVRDIVRDEIAKIRPYLAKTEQCEAKQAFEAGGEGMTLVDDRELAALNAVVHAAESLSSKSANLQRALDKISAIRAEREAAR